LGYKKRLYIAALLMSLGKMKMGLLSGFTKINFRAPATGMIAIL
jgi:hypothetical protein